MRTNVILDDELIKQEKLASGLIILMVFKMIKQIKQMHLIFNYNCYNIVLLINVLR